MVKRIYFWVKACFKLTRVYFQLLYGIWRIAKVPLPIVSIFGGSRLKDDDLYANQASELAQRCVDANISVVTGGGPGIMQAANCGAIYTKHGKGRSIGIGVRDLGEARNICMQEYLELDYFFARKWLLIEYSVVFIVFPGGFGTLGELFEVLTLIQTHKLIIHPVILVGSEYWQPFIDWLHNEPSRHDLVRDREVDLLFVTDDLDIVFDRIKKVCFVEKQSL